MMSAQLLRAAFATCLGIQLLCTAALTASQSAARIQTVLLPSKSPLVSFRILFRTGAAADPKGKEGLAALTAAMLAQGGTAAITSSQVLAALYPTSSSLAAQVDKEMTVFSGTAHIETLDRYYAVVRDLLLTPGFREDDFKRIRDNTLNFLKTSLRQSDDEELGKEVLYTIIYQGTSYGHHNRGTVSSVEKLTLADVKDFYARHYTQPNLTIGLAGGYPDGFSNRVVTDFAMLPQRVDAESGFETPKPAAGRRIEIVKRETDATAISLGFPIEVRRGGSDWPALLVAASYLGQHRSANGRLYNRMREIRGLNYGDYAYIEYFPQGGSQLTPSPNLGRRHQIFQLWIRPVEPQNSLFSLRTALYEYDKLIRDGLSSADFEATRSFLMKYTGVLTQTQSALLGYAIDSRYYGTPDYNTYLRTELPKLTVSDVNRAIQRYLKSDSMRIVIVARDADALRDSITASTASPIAYNSPKSQEVLDEDKVIERYPIDVRPSDVVVRPVEQLFQ